MNIGQTPLSCQLNVDEILFQMGAWGGEEKYRK